MTSAVNGLPKTLPQRSDFPWRKGAQARRTEKIVVGLCLTQFRQRNPYRRVRPIGDEKCPLVDDFGTLSIRTFLVVDEEYCDGSALPRHDPSKEKQMVLKL